MCRKARIGVLAAAVVCLAATAASATDLSTEVQQLSAAVSARLAGIGPSPASKPEKKETKKLQKALDLLGGYAGNDDIADFVVLGKAGKQLWRSKTADEAIRDEVGDVLQCLVELAKTQKGLAADVQALLSTDKFRTKVQAIIDKGESLLGTGLTLIDTDPVKAHKVILKAYKTWVKAGAKGDAWFPKDQRLATGGASTDWPTGLRLLDAPFVFAIENSSSTRYYIRDIIITGNFTNQGTQEVDLSPSGASLKDVLPPGTFEVEDLGGGAFYAPGMIEKFFFDFPTPPLHDLSEYISSYKYAAIGPTVPFHTFSGNIVLLFSNRQQPGGTEKRWAITIPIQGRTF